MYHGEIPTIRYRFNTCTKGHDNLYIIKMLTSDAGGGTAVPAVVGLLETGLGALSAPGTTSPSSFINDKYWQNTNIKGYCHLKK